MQIGKWLACARCAQSAIASGCASVTEPVHPRHQRTRTGAAFRRPPVAAAPEPAPVPAPHRDAVSRLNRRRKLDLHERSRMDVRCPTGAATIVAEALPRCCSPAPRLKNPARLAAGLRPGGAVRKATRMAARRFFESGFVPFRCAMPTAARKAWSPATTSRCCTAAARRSKNIAIRSTACRDDLLVVDLGASSQPNLKGMRLRGRMQGKKVVPYYTRAEIERGAGRGARPRNSLGGRSDRTVFPAGPGLGARQACPAAKPCASASRNTMAIHTNRSARVLIERGELAADKASMQGIKQWGSEKPGQSCRCCCSRIRPTFSSGKCRLRSLGPIGALGVP